MTTTQHTDQTNKPTKTQERVLPGAAVVVAAATFGLGVGMATSHSDNDGSAGNRRQQQRPDP